jgi:hypothetical protein
VQDDPDRSHIVYDDVAIPLLIGGLDGEPAEIVVDVIYEPGPAAWAFWTAIALVAAAVVAWGWRHPSSARRVAGTLAAVAGVGSVVVAVTRGAVDPPLWWCAVVLLASAAVVAGLVLHERGGPRTSTALGLVGAGGLTIALVVGVVDRAWLTHSQLPVDLAPTLGRLLVASALAFGGGVAVLAVLSILGLGAPAEPDDAVRPAHPPPPRPAG